jgi:hypothetical protein
VLIFDNCDSLAEKDPKMLELLQDTAKTAIDDSAWITVFVGSIGQAPERMEGLSDKMIYVRIDKKLSFISRSK